VTGGQLLGFLVVDLLLVLTPGADWSYAIASGVRGSRIAAAVGGLAAGYVVHAALVAVGVGTLIAQSAASLGILTLLGATYLAWVGLAVLRDPPAPAADDGPQQPALRTALRGASISGTNPKGLLLFFAVLPQFVDPRAAWPAAAQLAVLGAAHIALCFVVYLTVAATARRLLRSRPSAARVVGRASGASMVAIALLLTADQVARL
jgi:threonine/homoserine/homoserine lactone efflux protein